ncbi:MAG: branched-chain amino acid transaminase [Calditrichaeota bacterium]|nr:MAG: branched-chain amino acid transaminase [Calditrichota bacterium]
MPAFNEDSLIWFNGEFRRWKDATIHVMSHVVHYGSSVFEGIRCYAGTEGPVIMRLEDHIRRLFRSAKIYRYEMPYSEQEIQQACKDVIVKNDLREAYIRPIVFRGYGTLGVDPSNCPIDAVIGAWPWGKYLGQSALEEGVDVNVSTWQKMHANTMPTMAKAGGQYLNSQLVKLEAKIHGFVEGILLDSNGYVSEGSGENVFLVLDGKLYTPPFSSGILPGITRDSVITLAEEIGVPVIETFIPREMLYIADEVFFTGSAAEITPIRSIDKIAVGTGKPGKITRAIQKRFFDIISGEAEDKYHWLTPVNH